MKLGTLLLRDAVISLSQLEAALRAQVLYGGRLGTNLVELGFLDVDTLGGYLAQLHNVPCASEAQFQDADRSAIDLFGAELADRFTSFPLGYSGRALSVAMADPGHAGTIQELERQCGYPIDAHAAGELRILYYMERCYGLMRKARFVRTRSNDTGPPPTTERRERRRTVPPVGAEMPEAVRIEPSQPEPERASTSTDRPRVTYLNACKSIDAAFDRSQIADAIITFAPGRFDTLVLLLIREHNALGWRGYSDSGRLQQRELERLTLPLSGTSAFQAAADSVRPYRGPPLSAGKPVERRLWRAVAVGHEPTEVMVVPIVFEQEVVNLIYAHGLNGEPIRDEHAEELVELAARASDGYGRILRGTSPG